MYEENAIALPDYFFALQADCQKYEAKTFGKAKKYALCPLFKLFGENEFAKVYMAWADDALYFQIVVEQDEIKVSCPDVNKGDSVELFIDTKNLKSAKLTHRFCHHFYFLPELCEGRQAGEITRFRTEDVHPLASAQDLEVKSIISKRGYELFITIPEKCLVGYEPETSKAIGFSYRINRSNSEPQLFAHSHSEAIDQHP